MIRFLHSLVAFVDLKCNVFLYFSPGNDRSVCSRLASSTQTALPACLIYFLTMKDDLVEKEDNNSVDEKCVDPMFLLRKLCLSPE